MVFNGKYSIKSKRSLNKKPIEQVLHFSYLGCNIGYDYNNNVTQLNNYQAMCGTMKDS